MNNDFNAVRDGTGGCPNILKYTFGLAAANNINNAELTPENPSDGRSRYSLFTLFGKNISEILLHNFENIEDVRDDNMINILNCVVPNIDNTDGPMQENNNKFPIKCDNDL